MLAPHYLDYRQMRAIETAWHADPALPKKKRARVMIRLLKGMENFSNKRNLALHLGTSVKGSSKALGKYLERNGYAPYENMYRREVN